MDKISRAMEASQRNKIGTPNNHIIQQKEEELMVILRFSGTAEEILQDMLTFTESRAIIAAAREAADEMKEEKKQEPVPCPKTKEKAPADRAPDPKPEGSPEPKKGLPEPKKGLTEPEADGPISESEAVELRVLCEKFCAKDKDGKKKIQAFLKEHNVQRITVLPESLIEEFKKAVAI